MYENQRWLSVLAVASAICLGLSGAAAAEKPVLWGDLEPGPYGVGFETIEKYDNSRVSRPKMNYSGEMQEGERARPIQMCIWYPAVITEDEAPMVYGEYSFTDPANDEFREFLAEFQQRDVQRITMMFGGDRGRMMDFLNWEMGAVRDAAHAEGSFPLIIYFQGAGYHFSDNLIMCEYLASHGFIVAATHAFGDRKLAQGVGPADIETLVRDKEFIFGAMRGYQSLDANHLGTFGYSFGGLNAVVFGMRNSDVDAVLSLDGMINYGERFETFRGFHSFDPASLHVPLMAIYAADAEGVSMALIDSMVYSPRYTVGVAKVEHRHFSQFGWIGATDSSAVTEVVARKSYELIAKMVEKFFRLTLYGEESTLMTFKAGGVPGKTIYTMTTTDRIEIPPTEAEFTQMIRQGNIAQALEIHDRLKKDNPALVLFAEAPFNMIGYGFINRGQVENAVIVMKLNAEAYPNSVNVWDSYADAAQAAEDNATALMCYEKVLELLDDGGEVDPGLVGVLRTNAEEGIERLK